MNKDSNKFKLLGISTIILSVFLLVAVLKDSDDSIEFTDPGLENSIRDAIGKNKGEIHYNDVQDLQTLDASNRSIQDLSGMEALTELQELNLENNFVKNVSPLKKLMNLQDLNLRNNEIISLEDINFQEITSLRLEKLSLRHNVKRDSEGNGTRLEDISLLGKIISLKNLKLRDNHIEDLSPLSTLTKLRNLDIRENKFTTIKPLEKLAKLEKLNIRDNKIKSLKPIRSLTRLTYLNIHSNKKLKSLEPIKDLINLEQLIIKNVEIEDINIFKNLNHLQRLNAIDTGIEDLDQAVIEKLLNNGALQGEVRPIRLLYTLEAPTFSQGTGFYKEEFNLDITSGSDKQNIYYTLDGSEPTIYSQLYNEPINIKEMDENTATIVRAKIITEENTMSETITKTYFTAKDIDERFSLPIFSLITDPKNLFDEETGIYTEENAENSGSEWERPMHIEYMSQDGEVLLNQDAGIRIHGGMSRGANQKSLRLYARSEYAAKDTFENVFFSNLSKNNSEGTIDSFKHLILRNSGNDRGQTMFNDGFMQELAKPINTFDTQAYQPAVIFINGEYFGIENIRERLDDYYIESHYDIDRKDVAILENNAELYRGGNKDVYHYQNMIKYIEENNLQDDESLKYVETMMDFDSFIDYFATEIYYANADWPGNNIQFWRKTTDKYKKDAPYGHDGRWRWMMIDTDFGFYRSDGKWGYNDQPINYEHNTIGWAMSELDGVRGNRTWPNFLFRELMKNESFKNKFLLRFNDIANGYLNEYAATKKIDEKVHLLEQEMDYHIEKWGEIPSKEAWHSYIDRKKTFARERPFYIRRFIMEEFQIEDTISVNVSNETKSGYIRLNTMDIIEDLPGNEGNPVWSGTYFKGVSICVEAIPKNGYRFSHWEGINSDESYLEIDPFNDIEATAVFIKE